MTTLAWQRAGFPASSIPRPTTVLLHPWGGRGTDWETWGWTAGLARAGYDVLVPDLPGHADSAGVRVPTGYDAGVWTATTILGDLERLHVKHSAVIAYADACALAGHLAVRAPAAVVRAVFIGCDDREGFSQARETAAALRDPKARVWHLEASNLVRRARSDARHDPEMLARWLESGAWPAAPRLGALETPVLVAVGTEDSHRAGAPRLAALFPDARLVTVPGDDASVVSAPSLLETVVDFLSEVDLRPPLAPR